MLGVGQCFASLLHSNSKVFWTNWNVHTGNNINMGNQSEPDNNFYEKLASVFKDKFIDSKKKDKLYSEFITKYDECIMSGINESLSFSTEGIEKTTGSLNLCKTADCENLTAEHVIFAHPSDYVCLKESFDLCIKHGYCPSIMRTGIIRSII